MEKSEYRIRAYDMIYLVKCAINGETPYKSKVDGMNLEALFEVCQKFLCHRMLPTLFIHGRKAEIPFPNRKHNPDIHQFSAANQINRPLH